MDVNKYSVKQLFDLNISYRVPPFQRPYSWGLERQWEPLWDDVQKLATQHWEGRAKPHFMGAIVLQPLPSATGEVKKCSIIDGQQRLVTIQLLLRAAEIGFRALSDEHRAERIKGMTGNGEHHAGKDPDNLLKVRQSSPRERAAFRQIMQSETADGWKQTGLHKAFLYFKEEVSKWMQEAPLDWDARAEGLEAALSDHLHFVSVDLDDGEEPYTIFSTLNERGVTLEASDLIKNMLMYQADVGECEEKAEHIWGLFEKDDWWRSKTGENNLKRSQSDRFFDHWLTVKKNGEPRRPERLPHDFNSYIEICKDKGPNMEDLIQDLQHGAGTYLQIQKSKSQDATVNAALERMHALNIGAPMAFMLWLFMQKVPSQEQREGAVRVIESYIVRRKLLGQPANKLPDIFSSLIAKASRNPTHNVERIVVEHLSDQTGSYGWPTDKVLAAKLTQEPMSKQNKVRRSILLGLEACLRSDKVEPLGSTDEYTVEHLMPRKWSEEEWPLTTDNGQQSDEELRHLRDVRERKIEFIGNLTLATRKLNSTTGNKPWSEKKKELANHSSLFLNRDLLQSSPKAWDEAAIDARSQVVADLVLKTWPLPAGI
ncbi:MAG: DUF262 domain-containing protein [Chloroflexi bacterium]|nr:DUF262 domain-containing protein [Chloroflexota bacterium]